MSIRLIITIVLVSINGWCDDKFLEKFLPPAEKNIVRHSYYDAVYNEDARTGKWVIFTLSSLNTLHIYNRSVKQKFKRDLLVPTSPSSSSYKGGGYDRGHMCPADAMEFSKDALEETFLTTNIAPQNPNLNRGVWKSLEERVRSLLYKGSVMVVVVGVIHDKDQGYELVGSSKIGVPNYYYMIVYDLKKDKLSAFMMPNKDGVHSELKDYMVTVDMIDRKSGVDFFRNVVEKSRLEKVEDIFE